MASALRSWNHRSAGGEQGWAKVLYPPWGESATIRPLLRISLELAAGLHAAGDLRLSAALLGLIKPRALHHVGKVSDVRDVAVRKVMRVLVVGAVAQGFQEFGGRIAKVERHIGPRIGLHGR